MALSAGALLLASACGNDDSASSDDEPFEILFVTGITGVYAPAADAVGRGIQAKVDAINEAGGIHGRKLKLTVKDNQSDPTRGATIIQEALSGDDVPDLVVPGVSTNEAMAASPLLARNKVVGISPISSRDHVDPEKFPYTFSQSTLQEWSVDAGIEYVSRQGDVDSIGVVIPDDAVGDAAEKSIELALKDRDIEAKVVRFKTDSLDYTTAFQKALADEPDWLVMEGSGAQVASLLTSRTKASGEKVPTLVGIAASTQSLVDLAKGNELENLHATLSPMSAFIDEQDRGPQFTDFLERIKESGSIDINLSSYAAGWDFVSLWATAVESIDGEITGPAIKEALESGLPDGDDPQFPQYRGGFSPELHVQRSDIDDFTFGTPEKVIDGMTVVKKG